MSNLNTFTFQQFLLFLCLVPTCFQSSILPLISSPQLPFSKCISLTNGALLLYTGPSLVQALGNELRSVPSKHYVSFSLFVSVDDNETKLGPAIMSVHADHAYGFLQPQIDSQLLPDYISCELIVIWTTAIVEQMRSHAHSYAISRAGKCRPPLQTCLCWCVLVGQLSGDVHWVQEAPPTADHPLCVQPCNRTTSSRSSREMKKMSAQLTTSVDLGHLRISPLTYVSD